MEKFCARCGEKKPVSEFSKNRSRYDGLQTLCKTHTAEQQKEWYKNHAASHKATVARRSQRVLREYAERLVRYFQGHPCVDCGEPDPVVLEFDHVRGKKLKNISELVRNKVAWATIEREIKKCDARCANCHRRRTAKQLGFGKLAFLA